MLRNQATGNLSELQKPYVILVEDDTLVRNMLHRKLGKLIPGCQVERYSTAVSALKDIKKKSQNIDLIISDFNLIDKKHNGGWLLESIRGLYETRSIPFILVSADDSRENRTLTVNLGASAFIPKKLGYDMLSEIGAGFVRQSYENRKNKNSLDALLGVLNLNIQDETLSRVHAGESFHLVSSKEWEEMRSMSQAMLVLTNSIEDKLSR